jgi:DNA-binding MarR family transcriptional regulator
MLDDQIREIIHLIQRLMQAAECYNKELSKRYEISMPQLNCIIALYEKGPMPLNRIAQCIKVNSSTVTGIVDRLEGKGMVNRTRISHDRRVITVALTEAVLELAKNAPPPIQRKMVAGLERLSQGGRIRLSRHFQDSPTYWMSMSLIGIDRSRKRHLTEDSFDYSNIVNPKPVSHLSRPLSF